MSLAIQITSIIMSSIALVVALAALAMVIGMKLSTHRVEWKTLEFDKFEEEATKDSELDLSKEEEDFLNTAIKLQKKKKIDDPLDVIAETSNF